MKLDKLTIVASQMNGRRRRATLKKELNQKARLIIACMFPLPASVLNGGHIGSDSHVINPLYSIEEWSAADVFALPPEGFLD